MRPTHFPGTLLIVALLMAGPVPAHAQSVASLVTSLPASFGHLFEPTNGVIAAIGGGASLAVHPKDDDVARHYLIPSDGVHRFYRAGHVVGDTPAQAGAALAVYVVGRLSHQARVTRVGADLIDAQIVNGVLTTGIKVAVDRTRPNGGHRAFPSGHTSSTFATAAVIQRDLGWRAALPVYALGAYVGTSRVVDRAHFVSDVLFGTAVGLVSGRAVTVGHGRTRASVSAVPLRGGAALTVTMH